MATQHFPKRAIHLDFHTMPGVHDVARDFDPEEFAGTLKEAGAEYINVFARCNLGFAYYPTSVGIVHPGLKIDLLGSMVEACHRYGIRVTAYINAGIDHEHALRHREWCKVDAEGRVYRYREMGHFFRELCLNTGYRDHLLSMVQEVLERYPVDGFLLDCFRLSPCYGVECLDGMNQLGMDVSDPAQARDYARIVTDRLIEDVGEIAGRSGRDLNLYFNGLPYRKQPTHLELEVLPNGGWGYDYLPFAIRYARTLGKPYTTQTGRFHGGWGDFGGIKTEASLLHDCYYSISNGGGCCVGDHMHPRGKLDGEVYRLIGKVYSKLRELDPWTDGAEAVTEIVIVDPFLYHFKPGHEVPCNNVRGAARMLSELKYQFDVSDGENDLSRYRVVVLPDTIPVSGRLKEQLLQHIAGGGVVVSSGFSGLDPERTGFALDEYRISYEGPEPHNPSFFEAMPEVERDLPRMLTTIYEPGIAMRPKEGARVLARLHRPYSNRQEWDWRHEHLYTPPEADSGRPALVRCGGVFHFSFPVFTAYFDHAAVPYKTLVRNCLEMALPEPLVKVENAPSFAQVTLTRKAESTMVHLLAFVPEVRGKAQMIEDPILLGDVRIALRTDGQRIGSVCLAPSREKLEFEVDGKYAKAEVCRVRGYQMIVFE